MLASMTREGGEGSIVQVLAEQQTVVGAGQVTYQLRQGLERQLTEAAVEVAGVAVTTHRDDVAVHTAQVLE